MVTMHVCTKALVGLLTVALAALSAGCGSDNDPASSLQQATTGRFDASASNQYIQAVRDVCGNS